MSPNEQTVSLMEVQASSYLKLNCTVTVMMTGTGLSFSRSAYIPTL
jgi:hypothetical protein